MLEKKKERYAGWTNFETWLLNLNLTSDEYLYNLIDDFIRKRKDKDDYEIANEVKNLLEELTFKEDCGIFKIMDAWTYRDWQGINWVEIVKAWKSD